MLMFRTTHNALMAAKDAEIAFYRDALAKAETRAAEAEARAVALLDLTKPAPKPAPPEPRAADPVIVAIGRRAGASGPLRSQLAEFARDQRRARVPDGEIIKQIEDWTYRPGASSVERDQRDADAHIAAILD